MGSDLTSGVLISIKWQRAETLGALINGVFLVALCVSIVLEAIQRFAEPQTVSSPELVLIVGCLGLISNIAGLFLFHDHGHSHGGGHQHGGSNALEDAEEGHNHAAFRDDEVGDTHTDAIADERGNVADVLPQNTIAGWPKTKVVPKRRKSGSKGFTKSDEDESTARNSSSPRSTRTSITSQTAQRHRRHTSTSRSRYASADDIQIHPASFRNEIIAAGRLENIESGSDSDLSDEEEAVDDNEESPLIKRPASDGTVKAKNAGSHSHGDSRPNWYDSIHKTHKHAQPKAENSSGAHSHGDLNMRGVFLHVMGDALGNLGVIASALFIWLTNYPWRFYSDPLISLIITVIILASAIPLCLAASRILLQAVPAGISVDDIKDDISLLPGVVSCHHLHVWQLSDTKMVASLHIQVEYDFKGEGSARYMALARAVRKCLHEYGIHSSTIQPEFCLVEDHNHTSGSRPPSDNEGEGEIGNGNGNGNGGTARGSKAASTRSHEPEACLLDCGDECGDGSQCCAFEQKTPEAGK